ncbi:MAG: fused MFS/spermidine synthase [Bacteroidetes bacterium]|nr:fused MFS/spermidine synthase [Bacteroidota bacterium]
MKNNTSPAAASLSQQRLLILSFFEGSCVMVAELAGGKMLAPYYGTSLYVWASTLALTLGGLTLGYYIGGELSKREIDSRKKTLFTILAVASALVLVMPMLADFIMKRTLDMSFLTGVIISQTVFLLPPVMGMGMVSPLLISMIAEHNNSGKAAGLVYAVSTLGGVIATMLTGFWLVPLVGIAKPCIVIGAVLFLLSIIILGPKKKITSAAVLLLLIAASFSYNYRMANAETDKYKILYYSEGIMGQVKVVDFQYTDTKHNVDIPSRVMLVNHNWQTWTSRKDQNFSFLYYTRFTRTVISSMQPGSRALLIGLGGGTVARQMERYNVSYDAVEIDGRLPELAEKYFGLKHAVENTVVDDGRHYVNVCKKKYDLIIIDALLGENIPSHLLSKECFAQLNTLLNPNGKIFVEFDGIEDGGDGTAQQLLFNTIKDAGYNCRVFSSYPGKTSFDMMYVAVPQTSRNVVYDTAQIVTDSYYPLAGEMKKFEVTNMMPNSTDNIITDDKPVLDFYLKDRMLAFRESYLSNYAAEFLEDKMPFFK